MCWFIWDEFEIVVNDSIVNKALKRLSWNRKKIMRQIAQRNQQLRNDWMQRLSEWIAKQLIFLNENAACERIDDRRYDWASSSIIFTISQNLRKSKKMKYFIYFHREWLYNLKNASKQHYCDHFQWFRAKSNAFAMHFDRRWESQMSFLLESFILAC